MAHHVGNVEKRAGTQTNCILTILFSLSLLSATPLLQAQSVSRLTRLEGKPSHARLLGCTPQGAWEFEIDGKPTTLQAADFVRWGNPSDKLGGPILFLTDGSCLVADEAFTQLQIKDDEVTFDSKSIGENVRLPLQWIEGIMLKPEANTQRRNLWLEQIRKQPRDRDVALMENKDRIEGIVIELGEQELQLQGTAGNTLRISRKNVKAIAFQPALLKQPEPADRFLLLQLADGSSIRAAAWSGVSGKVQVRTAGDLSGLTFNIPLKKSANQSQLVGLLPIGFDAVFLSDRKETLYQHQPFLSLEWPYHRDRNVLGERLQTGGEIYEKGIGMHPDAELTYQLEQAFTRLDGAVGIDDSAEEQGSVIFEVQVERGDANWQTAFTSRLLRGGDPAEPFSIELKGVEAIRLKVSHAAEGDTLDRANWLDVRLLR